MKLFVNTILNFNVILMSELLLKKKQFIFLLQFCLHVTHKMIISQLIFLVYNKWQGR